MTITSYAAPVLLTKEHECGDFDCGHFLLNDWLRRYALQNQQANAAKTFVVCQGRRVIGYYSLTVGAVDHGDATTRVRKGLARHPIPVMVLARLAVDRHAQGIKLGASLLQDAVNRAVVVSQNAGVRALLVHAIHDRAKQFYEHYGFQESPQHPMTLMLRLNTVKA